MDKTENKKTQKPDETKKSRFSILVLMASILSLGSIIWTTWSMLDLFQVEAMSLKGLGGVSPIGLSVAVSMDLLWTATMVAEYRGQKRPVTWGAFEKKVTFDSISVIGWIEVLFVASLLGYHGSTVGNGAAAFAAVLPVFTRFTWMLALDGLRDPYDLTDAEKAEVAAKKRESRRLRADADATAEQNEAEAISKQRAHEAVLAELARVREVEREQAAAKIERQAMERQAEFDAEKAALEGQNDLKAMRQRLTAQLQIETLRSQQEITLERLDAQQEMRLRQPLILQGEVVRPVRRELEEFADDESEGFPGLTGRPDLSPAELRKAELAARFYAAERASEGSISKTAFCKKTNVRPPRLSEATAAFPITWFSEAGLGHVLDEAAREYRQSMI